MYRLPPGVDEPEFAALLRYWDSKRSGASLPSRADIDPIDLRGLLPHLTLLDVVRDGEALRFRYRLAGTAFTTVVGRDVTGVWFDELGPPERIAPVQAALEAAVRTGKPCYLAGRLTLPNERFVMAKRLGLPLAADGRTVDMILGAWLVQSRPPGDLAAGPFAEPPSGTPILLEGE